ncbi:MAG: hypothetical protein ACRDV0_04895 [Acidimicrobiales bacterium]
MDHTPLGEREGDADASAGASGVRGAAAVTEAGSSSSRRGGPHGSGDGSAWSLVAGVEALRASSIGASGVTGVGSSGASPEFMEKSLTGPC